MSCGDETAMWHAENLAKKTTLQKLSKAKEKALTKNLDTHWETYVANAPYETTVPSKTMEYVQWVVDQVNQGMEATREKDAQSVTFEVTDVLHLASGRKAYKRPKGKKLEHPVDHGMLKVFGMYGEGLEKCFPLAFKDVSLELTVDEEKVTFKNKDDLLEFKEEYAGTCCVTGSFRDIY